MRVIGEKPRPRALIRGFNETDAAAIADLFPTARVITSFGEVRALEWDLVIARGDDLTGSPSHLYTIGFGVSGYGPSDQREEGLPTSITIAFSNAATIATEFVIPDGLRPTLARLVEDVLVPDAQLRRLNHFLFGYTHSDRNIERPPVDPFLLTTEPRVLAGRFFRQSGVIAWCLPSVADPVPWVRVALAEFHEHDHIRFPHDPSWRAHPMWQTLTEEKIRAQLTSLEAEREAFLADLDRRQKTLTTELAAAEATANTNERRLLDSQGDDLVDTVADALRRLGFFVEKRDDEHAKGDALEDLLVRAPEDDDWVALVEVRGYKAGAKVNDLQRIARFVLRYTKANAREPNRRWYIVNQFLGQDPATRQPPLAGATEEVAEFARDDGMVIDTAALFELLMRVERRQVEPAHVRKLIIESLGRFALPD